MGRDGLWIIDQHVAHERILFEQVLKQRAAGNVEIQRLLMPLILQLTPTQQFEYARIADELNAYGFETEPFGQRTVAIQAAPAGVGPSDIEKIVFEILEIVRKRTALRVAGRSTARPLRNHRMQGRNQGQYAARDTEDRVATSKSRPLPVPDDLPAWPTDRTSIQHARHSEELSPDLNPAYIKP